MISINRTYYVGSFRDEIYDFSDWQKVIYFSEDINFVIKLLASYFVMCLVNL